MLTRGQETAKTPTLYSSCVLCTEKPEGSLLKATRGHIRQVKQSCCLLAIALKSCSQRPEEEPSVFLPI